MTDNKFAASVAAMDDEEQRQVAMALRECVMFEELMRRYGEMKHRLERIESAMHEEARA